VPGSWYWKKDKPTTWPKVALEGSEAHSTSAKKHQAGRPVPSQTVFRGAHGSFATFRYNRELLVTMVFTERVPRAFVKLRAGVGDVSYCLKTAMQGSPAPDRQWLYPPR
jgi:hypothetical protein